MSSNVNISMSVIKRLPRYYRFLGKLRDEGHLRISSGALSSMMGTTASQIRQDLNCFGGFGQQGYGYNVEQLYNEIGKILGVDRMLDSILIGVGNLGRAIASHMEFEKRGIALLGIFDKNPSLAGTSIKQYKIYHADQLKEFCAEHHPKMAIVCTPTVSTEKVIDELVSYGITGFWNYSHFDILSKYPNVNVQNVHLSDSLLTLGYQMKNNC
ncbi:MAG: redox-sensing transcriptional repressor Rex [Clostridia bacterium]|nr:redox-sensing transcriptional repressor Rex [Clostridia bacterium]